MLRRKEWTLLEKLQFIRFILEFMKNEDQKKNVCNEWEKHLGHKKKKRTKHQKYSVQEIALKLPNDYNINSQPQTTQC